MTDTSCGWCIDSCIERADLQSSQCRMELNHPSLVLNATHCSVCADFVDCDTCLDVSLLLIYGIGFYAYEFRLAFPYFMIFFLKWVTRLSAHAEKVLYKCFVTIQHTQKYLARILFKRQPSRFIHLHLNCDKV